MLLEFQMDTGKLAAILLSQIREQKICVTEEFPYAGDVLVLDHIELPDTGAFSRASSTAVIHVPDSTDETIDSTVVHFSQPAILHAVKTSTLEAHNHSASPDDVSPTITLILELTMKVQNGVPRFRVWLADVDAGLLEAVAPGAGAMIQNHVSFDVTSDMDLSSIEDLLGTDVTATNAGMVVDQDLERVVMRIELNGTGSSVTAWQSFFTGPVPDHLGGKDWSILIDKDLIVPAVVSRIADGVSQSSQFQLESGPSGSWNPLGPVVDVSFSGEAIDACTCFFWDIDLNVDVTVNVGLSVPQNNVLQMDAALGWDLDDAEVFCCALTSALFWPIVGAIMLGEGKINWGEFLGGIAIGPLGMFIATIAVASSYDPEIKLDASCHKVDDTHIQCTQPIAVSAGFGAMTTNTLVGLNAGPLFQGSMPTALVVGQPQLDVSVNEFSWHLGGSCSTQNFQAFNDASILVTNAAQGPMCICETKLLDDTLGVYQVHVKDGGSDPNWVIGELTVTCDMTPQFLAAKYDCKVMIKTNGGARIITLAAPSPITKEEETALQALAMKAKADCTKLVDPFWAATHHMNPKWIPDPPPESVFENLWQILVVGLQANEQVVATDAKGHALATARATARGVAQLTVMTSPAAGGAQELALDRRAGAATVRSLSKSSAKPLAATHVAHKALPVLGGKASKGAAAAAGHEKGARRLMIKQIVVVRDSRFGLGAQARSIGAGRLANVPVVFAVTSTQVRVFDVGTLARPFLAQSVRCPGLRGATLWNDSLLVWGDDGLAALAAGESRVGFPHAGIDVPVHDVVRVGARLAVLTDDGVHLLDRRLATTSHIPAKGSTFLTTTGTRLLIGSKHGVDVFDVARAHGPAYEASHVVASSLVPAPDTADVKHSLYSRRDAGGGSVVEVTPKGLVELTRYEDDPWFVDGARVGKTLARLVDDRTTLLISHIARSHMT